MLLSGFAVILVAGFALSQSQALSCLLLCFFGWTVTQAVLMPAFWWSAPFQLLLLLCFRCIIFI